MVRRRAVCPENVQTGVNIVIDGIRANAGSELLSLGEFRTK